MSDAELRDQAVAELKLTTVGYLSNPAKGGCKHDWILPPAGSHWANAMGLLAKIGTVTPPKPSSSLPVPAGSLLYDGGFEDGTLNRWRTDLTGDTSVAGSFDIVPGITADARYACRISLPAHTGKGRQELDSGFYLPEGRTVVYEVVFRVDSDISPAFGHTNVNLSQWKVGPLDKASPEPCYTGGVTVLDDGAHMRLYGGQVTPAGSCNYPAQPDWNIGALPKGQVCRLAAAIKVGNTGWVRAWLDRGAGYGEVVPLTNQPTMSTNAGSYRCRIGLYHAFPFSVPIVVTYGSCRVWEAA